MTIYSSFVPNETMANMSEAKEKEKVKENELEPTKVNCHPLSHKHFQTWKEMRDKRTCCPMPKATREK